MKVEWKIRFEWHSVYFGNKLKALERSARQTGIHKGKWV